MTSLAVRPEATATITVTEPVLVSPARSESVYAWGFEGYASEVVPAAVVQSLEGASNNNTVWTSSTSGSFVGTFSGMSGSGVAPSRSNSFATDTEIKFTATGLTPGVAHTVAVNINRSSGSLAVNAKVGVDGMGFGPVVATPVTDTATVTPVSTVTYTFTATATSHVVLLHHSSPGATGATQTILRVIKATVTRDAYVKVTNDGKDGWTSGGSSSVWADYGTSGDALVVSSATATTVARAFSGLVIGHQYTLRGKRRTTATGDWETVSQTITAASTAQAFSLPSPQPEGVTAWDDMQMIHHIPAVYTNVVNLPISQGKVRLDENYSPYITANFTVPLTTLELLEQLDPRDPQRVTVTATEAVSGVTRTYNLGLRSRSVDHKRGSIEIEASSDEILLWDRKHVAKTVDSTPRQYEANLRFLCGWALSKVGATLAPGSDNANLTAAWPVTNLFPDPSAENASLAWTAGSGAPTFTRQSSPVWSGSYALRINATAAQAYLNSPVFSASAGRMYTASFHIRSSVARSARVMLRFMGANGNASLKDAYATASNTSTSAWQRRSVTSVAPPGTTSMQMYVITDGNASGNFHYIDGIMLNEGILEDWFSGGTANTAQYTYEWTNVANDSSSERIPVVERLPELFNWKPGQALQEFLQPLLNAAGLRLFCDEDRVWRLVNPETYEVPGYVVAQSGHNATEGTDTISRNTEEWADAVVVAYTWTDANGIQKTAYDVAGDPNGKTLTRELEREYPGPGAAQALLNSFKGRGRIQAVTVVGQYGATPGQDVTINLPGALTQTGKVRAVEFDLSSGLMSLETRGLTDALPGSWAMWDPAQTWSAVSPTLAWKDA